MAVVSEDVTVTDSQLEQAVTSLFSEETHFLQKLIGISSVVGSPGEAEIQDLMSQEFSKLGLRVDRWDIHKKDLEQLPGFSPAIGSSWEVKQSVVGTHYPSSRGHGDSGRKRCRESSTCGERNPLHYSLIFNGHVDVVPTGPAELWSYPPFEGTITKDGMIYGRGSGDMKSGVVAFMYAYKVLRSLGLQPASVIHFQSVLDEECTGNGTLACLQRGYRADGCVIPEPFSFLVTAQLGVSWLQLHVVGKPAHVLDTSMGCNAIEACYSLYTALKQLEIEWNGTRFRAQNRTFSEPFEAFAEPIRFNLGKISGGEWNSSVPVECTAGVRISFYPGMRISDVHERVDLVIAKEAARLGVKATVSWPGFAAEGCVFPTKEEPSAPASVATYTVATPSSTTLHLFECLSQAHQSVRKNEKLKQAPITCTTDARHFHLYYNIPVTCYGPSGVVNIHGIDERLPLQSLKELTQILAKFVILWCGIERVKEF